MTNLVHLSREDHEALYASAIEAEVAELRLKGYAPAAIRELTGLDGGALHSILKAIRKHVGKRILAEKRDTLRLQAGKRVELALVARNGEPQYAEVFGVGPLPRASSPAMTEDGDVALPAARVVDAEELAAPLFRTLGRMI